MKLDDSGRQGEPAPGREALRVLGQEIGWRWPLAGMVASTIMALTGPSLVTATDGRASAWWFGVSVPPDAGGHAGTLALFYVGMALLSVAWLGLGLQLRRRVSTPSATLWLVALLWSLPLVIGPALFSRDVYSYAAQGWLTHIGLNPYTYGPNVLPAFGQNNLLSTVSPVWRSTVAPYGPLFMVVAGAIMGKVGNHLVATVVIFRLLELVGVALIAVFVPRLARRLGTDPARAIWLTLLSPVIILSFVAAGHNDALMVGLVLAGVTLALEDRPLLGIVLCALAATVKVPALAGVVFIAMAWVRQQPSRSAGVRVLFTGGASVLGVLVGVSLAARLGWGWLSSGALSTPGDVVVAVTPSAALGATIASVLRAIGAGVANADVIGVLRVAGGILAAVVGAGLLARTRMANLVAALGLALLVVVLAGPVLWPWYLTWGLVLLATTPMGQRSRAMVAALAVIGFIVSPAGTSAITSRWSLAIVAVLVICGVSAWRSHRRRVEEMAGTALPIDPLTAQWPLVHMLLTPGDHPGLASAPYPKTNYGVEPLLWPGVKTRKDHVNP